jgi:hypothetical protein
LNAVLDREGYMARITNPDWLQIGEAVGGVALDPDGGRLFVSTFRTGDAHLQNGKMFVWDMTHPRERPRVIPMAVAADSLEIASNGAFIVAGARANVLYGSRGVEVWSVSDGTPRSIAILRPEETIKAFAAAKSSNIVVASTAKAIFVWDLDHLQSPLKTELPIANAEAIALKSSGSLLAAFVNREIVVFDLTNAESLRLNGSGCRFGRTAEYVSLSKELLFSDDDDILACMGYQGELLYWPIQTGRTSLTSKTDPNKIQAEGCSSIESYGRQSFVAACSSGLVLLEPTNAEDSRKLLSGDHSTLQPNSAIGSAIAASHKKVVTANRDSVWVTYFTNPRQSATAANLQSGLPTLAAANHGESFLFLNGVQQNGIPPTYERDLMIWDLPAREDSVPRKLIAKTMISKICKSAGDQPIVLVSDEGYLRLASLDANTGVLTTFAHKFTEPWDCAGSFMGKLAVAYHGPVSEQGGSAALYDLSSDRKRTLGDGNGVGVSISQSGRWFSTGSAWFHFTTSPSIWDTNR